MDPMRTQVPADGPPPTMAAALRARAADSPGRTCIRFEGQAWSFADSFAEACRYAQLFLQAREPERPFHVGVSMENLPAFRAFTVDERPLPGCGSHCAPRGVR
jgi:acyl-CoA synthetase (AMP-forming)/AMP-acid ligase II